MGGDAGGRMNMVGSANGIIREKVVIRTHVLRKPKAQLKLRLPEDLRHDIERAAADTGCSMNEEIVSRLRGSFLTDRLDSRLARIEMALSL
jgi:hypothetical protein